jgi:hypothetical protein
MGVLKVGSVSNSQSYNAPSDSTDVVQLGESRMSDVADRLHLDLNSLIKANPQIQDPNSLTPGQEINLPKSTPPIPLRDPAMTADSAKPTTGLPPAPMGDPIAASAFKANLSAPVQSKPDKPEDYVTLYPIHPGNTNSSETHVVTDDKSVGDVYRVEHHPEGSEVHDSAGLASRLSELNGGRPLTDFEKNLAAGWGKQDSTTTLTPIVKIGDVGVQAYVVDTGGSGDRIKIYYDRDGHILAGPFHDEAGLVNEGLGPIDYVIGGLALKNLAGGLIRGARGMFAGESAAGALGKATVEGEGEAAASGAGKSSWREGSGTSIYNPKPGTKIPAGETETAAETKASSPKTSNPPTRVYTKDERDLIKWYEQQGMTRQDAEDLLNEPGGPTGPGPNGGGTTRIPEWKKPGAGKKHP